MTLEEIATLPSFKIIKLLKLVGIEVAKNSTRAELIKLVRENIILLEKYKKGIDI